MRKTRQVLGTALALTLVCGATGFVQNTSAFTADAAEVQEQSIDLRRLTGTGISYDSIALDGSETGAAANIAFKHTAATGGYGAVVGTYQVSKTLRICVGDSEHQYMNLHDATAIEFLVKADNYTRMQFGLIDSEGTAVMINNLKSSTDLDALVTYQNYFRTESRTKSGRVSGEGVYLESSWGATHVRIDKSAFVNAVASAFKPSGYADGIYYGTGFADISSTQAKTFKWDSVQSVFVDFTASQAAATRTFYSVSYVDADGNLGVIADAAKLTQIEKPAYSLNGAGYKKNQYSFGTRPTFTEDISVFNAPVYTAGTPSDKLNFDVKQTGKTGKTTTQGNNHTVYEYDFSSYAWDENGDGLERNYLAYHGLTFHIDLTHSSIIGETNISWTFRGHNGIDYVSDGYGFMIPDEGAPFATEDTTVFPDGFKGTVYIPFTSFTSVWDTNLEDIGAGDDTNDNKGDRERIKTFGMVIDTDNSVAEDATGRITLSKVKLASNVPEVIETKRAEALDGAWTTFQENFSVVNGASLGFGEGNVYALRFRINTSKDATVALEETVTRLGGTVEYGALAKGTTALNGAALTTENAGSTVVMANWFVENEQYIVSMPSSAFVGHTSDEITVRGYCRITFGDGTTLICYTGFNALANGTPVDATDGQVSRDVITVATAFHANYDNEMKNATEETKAIVDAVLSALGIA